MKLTSLLFPNGRTIDLPRRVRGKGKPKKTALEITSPAELHVLRCALEHYDQSHPPIIASTSLYGAAIATLRHRAGLLQIEELPKR